MPRRPDAIPSSDASVTKPRMEIAPRIKRVPARQTRGPLEGGGAEILTVHEVSGTRRRVAATEQEIKERTDEADRQFDRLATGMVKAAGLDKNARSLLDANKEQIIALAGRDTDYGAALMKTMETAIGALVGFDDAAKQIVKDSGYRELVADALSESLKAERERIFTEALRQQTDSPSSRRTLEQAVKAELLREAAKQTSALAETVGTPEEIPMPDEYEKHLESIRSDMKVLHGLETRLKTEPNNEELKTEINTLDELIKSSAREWARSYQELKPKTTPESIMQEAERLKLDEFLDKKDLTDLGHSDSRHATIKPKREGGRREQFVPKKKGRERATPVMVEEEADKIGMHEGVDVDEFFESYTGPKEVPHRAPPTPEPPGTMQRLGRWARKMFLPMALFLGMKTVETQQQEPEVVFKPAVAQMEMEPEIVLKPAAENIKIEKRTAKRKASPSIEERGQAYANVLADQEAEDLKLYNLIGTETMRKQVEKNRTARVKRTIDSKMKETVADMQQTVALNKALKAKPEWMEKQ